MKKLNFWKTDAFPEVVVARVPAIAGNGPQIVPGLARLNQLLELSVKTGSQPVADSAPQSLASRLIRRCGGR